MCEESAKRGEEYKYSPPRCDWRLATNHVSPLVLYWCRCEVGCQHRSLCSIAGFFCLHSSAIMVFGILVESDRCAGHR